MKQLIKYLKHILLCTDKPLRHYNSTSIYLECSCGYRTIGWEIQEEIITFPDVLGK